MIHSQVRTHGTHSCSSSFQFSLPLISLTKSYSPFKIWPKCFVHPQVTHDTWPHSLPPYTCIPYHILSHISVASALVCFSQVIIYFLRKLHQFYMSLSPFHRDQNEGHHILQMIQKQGELSRGELTLDLSVQLCCVCQWGEKNELYPFQNIIFQNSYLTLILFKICLKDKKNPLLKLYNN